MFLQSSGNDKEQLLSYFTCTICFFTFFYPKIQGFFLWFPLNFSLHPVLALRHPSGLDHWRRSHWEDPNGSFGDSDSWCATLRCAEAAEVWIWLEHDSLDCLDMFGLEFGYRLVGWFHFGLILMSGDDFFEWQSAARWDYCGSEEWEAALSLSLSHTHVRRDASCVSFGPRLIEVQDTALIKSPRGEILAKHVAHGQVCVLSSVFLLLNMSWHVTAVMGMGMTLAWDMFRNIWWVPVESVKAQWWKRRGGPKLWLPWTKLRSVSLTKSDKC